MAADGEFAASLAHDIWSSPEFQADLAALTRARVAQAIGRPIDPIDPAVLRRLIQSAPVLALSPQLDIGEASYRIASGAFSLARENLPGVERLLSLVLGRRGNFPAVDLMVPHGEDGLPSSLRAEAEVRRAENTVQIGEQERSLTDFQVRVWRDLKGQKSVAVSAPTSAGKSYVFRAFLQASIPNRPSMISLVLVPTRALINQMQDQLREPLEQFGGRVVSVPRPQSDIDGPLCYVLTQERLQVLLEADPNFAPELVLVDEAQSVGEDGRGVILQSVIDEILVRRPGAQILFTLPISADAARFGSLFNVAKFVDHTTHESPVGQTVILLEVDSVKMDTVQAAVWQRDGVIEIGEFKLDSLLTTSANRLARLAWEFGRHAPSIVYADAQPQCETISELLTQLSAEAADDAAPSDALLELSAFVSDHVHPKFALAETVKAGVGYHYGYIPSLVRKEIEHAFDDGVLKYIVCTTTLLKGVNLPARNLFMSKPKVGGKHMQAPDFWNLAGRAGRLGREFDGNVFLIDYGDWKRKHLSDEPLTPVAPAMSRVVGQAETFARFVEKEEAPRGDRLAMENAFAKLYRDQQTGRLERTLERLDLPAKDSAVVRAAIEGAVAEINLPPALLKANPWVSPRRQAALLSWTRKRLSDPANIRDLIPPHPLGAGADTYQRLCTLFRRCQRELEGRNDRTWLYYANLGLSWMRGKTIPQMIDDLEKYKIEQGEAYELPELIRGVLKDIESHLRFRLVRLTACYNTVVAFALEEAGHGADATYLPSVPLYLEMGASSETMLSYMELGLSRITARLLQDKSLRPSMTAAEARSWLERNRRLTDQLPRACRREISALLG